METVTAFPLSWPPGYPRVRYRSRSPFKVKSFETSREQLFAELRRMGATKIILSTNIPIRQDGMPYADLARRRIPDPGVAIYFHFRGSQRSLACDKWERLEDNLHALELTIEAMRGLERWGASSILERAFTGFTALPAPPQWWDVLGVQPEASLETCERVYREKIMRAHPDVGGTEGMAASLNWAIEEARKAKRGAA